MDLRRVEAREVAPMRERRRRGLTLGIVPQFYDRLARESTAFLVAERSSGGAARNLGYVLMLEREHEGHTHVTVLEAYLEPGEQHRFEELLDVLRDQQRPTTYLARTDDCRLDATLLARGLQVEPTALVLLAERARDGPAAEGSAGEDEGDGSAPRLRPLAAEHMDGLRRLLSEHDHTDVPGGQATAQAAHSHEHRHGPTGAELLEELEVMAGSGRHWVLMGDDGPTAVIARGDGADGVHELLDVVVARTDEAEVAWALRQAAREVTGEGLRPAAVLDAMETARYRIFRAAGFHTAAAYLVFYDPEAGRPSVVRVSTEELRALLASGQRVRVVDVMGEEHWRAGHIPGAEWIDFKGLAREARRRFRPEEPIIVYCNGFT